MKTIAYHNTINKSSWERGPWDDEPDKMQWKDKETGLPCLIKRSSSTGNLCGYVGVDEKHPLYGKKYDDVDADVHGGLSYSDSCSEGPPEHVICHIVESGESDHVWWFGFDCGHAFDVSPGLEAQRRMVYEEMGRDLFTYSIPSAVYRNWAFVEEEVRNLAKQLRNTKCD